MRLLTKNRSRYTSYVALSGLRSGYSKLGELKMRQSWSSIFKVQTETCKGRHDIKEERFDH